MVTLSKKIQIRLHLALIAVFTVIVLGVTAATAALGATAPSAVQAKQPSAASAFLLPPAGACVKGHALTVEVRRLPHVRWLSATVKLDGTRVETLARSQVTEPITLRHLPGGNVVVSITARPSSGRSVSTTREYATCVVTPNPAKPPVVPSPVPPVKPPPAEPTKPVSPSGAAAGEYIAGTTNRTFFVSADSTQVQDVAFYYTSLTCSSGKTLSSQLIVKRASINAGATFAQAETESALLGGKPVEITYTISGQFDGTSGSGSYREDVSYDDEPETCTSGNQPWSASVAGEGDQAAAPPRAGEYIAGTTNRTFFVSPDDSHIQDVTFLYTSLNCSTNETISSQLIVKEAAVVSGMFAETETENALIGGRAAKVTYTFVGDFHGFDSSGRQRADGTYREDVAFEDGSKERCTTANQPWSADINSDEGDQTAATPLAGEYVAGTTNRTFSVSPGGGQIKNVRFLYTALSCSNKEAVSSQLIVKEATIDGDTTFATTEAENAPVNGRAARITYMFTGHFHGFDSSGHQRVVGTYREDVAFEDGSKETCTTNNQAWSAIS